MLMDIVVPEFNIGDVAVAQVGSPFDTPANRLESNVKILANKDVAAGKKAYLIEIEDGLIGHAMVTRNNNMNADASKGVLCCTNARHYGKGKTHSTLNDAARALGF